MSTIKIFLASSDELKPEREMMASLANSLNTVLEQQGVHVIVVEWENLDASMGIHHKQDDYNEKLRDCEMCLVLYWTKFGMYTKTELDTAYKELQAGNNPRKLYVYFKNGAEPTEELKEFRDSFPTRYGHFFTSFENFDTLKAHFLLQFMEYQSQVLINTNAIEIKDGKVVFGGIEYVNLKNVPFAGNNEEYNEIKDEIAELQEDLENLSPDSPRYAKKSEKLQKLQEKLSKMENSLWDTALMITRLSTTKCSERLKRAMDLFTAGDNKGAQAVLNEEEIERDVEHNLHLIQLGEEGKKGLATNIEEYKLKIKTLENDIVIDNSNQIINLYQKAVSAARGHIDICDYTDLLWDFVDFLHYQNLYSMGGELYDECLTLIRNNASTQSEGEIYNLALCLNSIANFHKNAGEFKKAEKEYLESIEIRKKLVETNRDSYLPGLARCLEDIAVLKSDLCDHASGLQLIEEAVAYRKEFHDLQKFSNSSEKYAHCLGSYAYILHCINKYDDAINVLTESIDILKQLSNQDGDNLDLKNNIASYLDNLSILYKDMGNYSLAENMSLDSLKLSKDLYDRRPNAYGPDYACHLLNLGSIYHNSKELEKAILYFSDSLSVFSKMDDLNPGVYKGDMALCYMNRANSYVVLGDYEKSDSDFNFAIELYRLLVTEDEEYYAEYLAICLNNQSRLLNDKCKYDAAIKILLESIDIYRKLSVNYPDAYKPELADALSNIGMTYNLANYGLDAEKSLLEAIELIDSLKDNETYSLYLAKYYLYLGRTYYHNLNKPNEAVKALTKSVQYYKSSNGVDGVNVTHELGLAYGDLANACDLKKDKTKARLMYLESITVLESIENPTLVEQSSLANSYNNLAWFYYEGNNLDEAEPLAIKAVALEEDYCKALGQDSRSIAEFKDTLDKIKEQKCL